MPAQQQAADVGCYFMRNLLSYLFLLLSISPGGRFCSCVPDNSVINAYKSASIVFTGRVTQIDTVLISDTANVISSSTNPKPHIDVTIRTFYSVKFTISNFLKVDSQSKTITVMTEAAGTRCGIQFLYNVPYLVYAYSQRFALVEGLEDIDKQNKILNITVYSTNSCTRTTTAVKQEIAELIDNKLIR